MQKIDLNELKKLASCEVCETHDWVTQEWAQEHFGSEAEAKFVAACSPAAIRELIAMAEASAAPAPVVLAWSNLAGTKFCNNGEKWKHQDCVLPLNDARACASPFSSASADKAESRPTDISQRLRDLAEHLVVPGPEGKLMRDAADEIERYHGGMLNWKRTAESQAAMPGKVAPTKPTEAMLKAAVSYKEIDADDEIADPFVSMADRIYQAMLNAAPPHPATQQAPAIQGQSAIEPFAWAKHQDAPEHYAQFVSHEARQAWFKAINGGGHYAEIYTVPLYKRPSPAVPPSDAPVVRPWQERRPDPRGFDPHDDSYYMLQEINEWRAIAASKQDGKEPK